MAKTIKVFDFKVDMRGAWIVLSREPISNCCLTDSEVDERIEALKDDLDAVAKRMKLAIREQTKKLLYPE